MYISLPPSTPEVHQIYMQIYTYKNICISVYIIHYHICTSIYTYICIITTSILTDSSVKKNVLNFRRTEVRQIYLYNFILVYKISYILTQIYIFTAFKNAVTRSKREVHRIYIYIYIGLKNALNPSTTEGRQIFIYI